MIDSIRDVAARMRRLHDSGVAYDSLAIRVADWVLAVTEPGGDVVSVEECEQFIALNEVFGVNDGHCAQSTRIAHSVMAALEAEIAELEGVIERTRKLARKLMKREPSGPVTEPCACGRDAIWSPTGRDWIHDSDGTPAFRTACGYMP